MTKGPNQMTTENMTIEERNETANQEKWFNGLIIEKIGPDAKKTYELYVATGIGDPPIETALTNELNQVCDCCTEEVAAVDDLGLCFNCSLVQTFASIIEDRTDLCGDCSVDLACDLVGFAMEVILPEFKGTNEIPRHTA